MNVGNFIKEFCGLDDIPGRDEDLIESGILDSFAVIELVSALDDEGIEIHLTRIDLNSLRTVSSIEKLIEEAKK